MPSDVAAAPPWGSKRVAILLGGLVAAEAVVVLGFLGLGEGPIRGGDGPGYHTLAVNLLDHGHFSFSASGANEPALFRTPGYPAFLAVVYALAGRTVLAVCVAQFVVLVVTAWLLYLLALRFVGRLAAAVAGVLCATYPPFVFQATFHLTETVATCLSVLFVLLCVTAVKSETGRAWWAVSAGAVAGISALVRPSSVLLPGLVIGLILVAGQLPSWRTRLAVSLWLTLAFLLCVLPWTVRNYLVSGRWIPLATGTGVSLLVSAQQYEKEISYRLTVAEWGEIIADQQRRYAHAAAGLAAGRDGPVAASVQVELIVDRGYTEDAKARWKGTSLPLLLTGAPVRVAYLWAPADTSPWPSGVFHRAVQAWHLALALLAVAGVWSWRASLLPQWPLWALPLYYTLLHLLFHMEPRYSFPARPFVLVYAAAGLARLGGLLKR